MKRYIILFLTLMLFVLGGCTIETKEFYQLDEEQRAQIIAELKEELAEQLRIEYQPSLTDVENMIISVVKHNQKAIVGISNIAKSYNQYVVSSTGSGFIYDYNPHEKIYYVITNAHVVSGASKLEIVLYNGETVSAQPIFGTKLYVMDVETDIAVICFRYDGELKVVEFANSDNLVEGQFVIAIGNPLGYEFFGSVTFGVISGLSRNVQKDYFSTPVIQHDAAISPGNSGGPLFDINGRVVGVNNMKIVQQDVSNMGFAVPSNIALSIAEILREEGEVVRAALGIYYQANQQVEGGGVLVVELVPGGAAEQAGIQIGDIIIRFDEEPIKDWKDLVKALEGKKPDEMVTIVVRRGQKEITFNVKLQKKIYN